MVRLMVKLKIRAKPVDMADIRAFFGAVSAGAPAFSPSKPAASTSAPESSSKQAAEKPASKKAAPGPAKKKPQPAPAPAGGKKRALEISAEDRKLLAAAKKKRLAKQAKVEAKEDGWHCPEELLELYEKNQIHKHLRDLTTDYLKGICTECGIPRTGAKYKLMALIYSHVEEGVLRKECDRDGGTRGRVAKTFAKGALTFKGARALFVKLVKGFGALPDAVERMESVIGAARGMDYHVHAAITGPEAKQYNGSRGETGLDMQVRLFTLEPTLGQMAPPESGRVQECHLVQVAFKGVSTFVRCHLP